MLRIVLIVMIAACITLAATGCDKISQLKVDGNIAGQVLNPDGSPRGYVLVVLIDEAGAEVQQQNAEDSGNFFFKQVPAGAYKFKIMPMGASAGTPGLPIEDKTVKLGLGKTLQTQIKLLPEPAAST